MPESSGRSKGWALGIAIFLQIVLVVVLIPESAVQKALAKERSLMSDYLGDESCEKIVYRAEKTFNNWFVSSGLIRESFNMFIPTSQQQARSVGIERLGEKEGWFPAVEKRLYSFWTMVFFALQRIYSILAWAPVTIIFMTAAFYDGWMSRNIKLLGFDTTSAPKYGIARHLFVIGLFVPIFYAFAPITVHPVFAPLWGVFMSILLMIKAANLQRF